MAVYDLCSTSGCTPNRNVEVTTVEGNVYANVIPAAGEVVTGTDTVMGSVYDSGISLDSDT